MRVVFDTSVLVAAARSRRGGSFVLVSSIPAPEYQLCLSVGLYTEWQEVLTRAENLPRGQTAEDDMVLELAFAAGCRYIVTHNVKDFHGAEQLGATALSPRDFLSLIRKSP